MSYSSKLVPFDLLLIPTTEATFVDQVGELLLHHIFDFLDGFFQSGLTRTGYVKVQRGVLGRSQLDIPTSCKNILIAYRGRGHALVGIIAASGRDIFTSQL